MKRLLTLGVLVYLVTGSATLVRNLPEPLQIDRAIAAKPPATAVVSQREVFYLSDRFGFRIVSPSGYIIAPSETQPPAQPATPLQVLEVWQQADILNRATLSETPHIIRITIYKNDARLPLTHWKGDLSRTDDRPLTVGGQTAIAYGSTGLYEYDNVLFRSPDGRHIFRITAGYAEAKAPIRQTFQELISSFTFDVRFDPKSASSWRIDYNRLQRLLAAKDWQAADRETRAILQRLAGPNGDLLFSSKAVLSRIPLADLKTLDTLWSNASGGRFGFSAQYRLWQQAAKRSKNPKIQAEHFAQQVGWRRTQPLPETNPLGIEFSGTLWRLDTELNYTTTAPVGHFPWAGVSSSQVTNLLAERSLGCGSCTTDAIYLVNDRYGDYLPALFARFKSLSK